jgi:Flp pilus assembly protein TadG
MKINKVSKLIKDEEGSAIIEFIILALPLFIPLVIYLTSVNSSAQIQYEARNFARQIARVYVTSPSQESTSSRVAALIDVFSKNSFPEKGIDLLPTVQISCSMNPCISPNSRVVVDVVLTSSKNRNSAKAKAIQTVDSWRNS